MKLEKLKPWNWFKHEQGLANQSDQIPVQRRDAQSVAPVNDPFWALHREMDRLMDQTFRSFGLPVMRRSDGAEAAENRFTSLAFRPQLDVSGRDDQYEIKLDLPGLTRDDVTIELKDHTLIIKGEKESRNEQGDRRYYSVERSYGSFQRTLALPEDALVDDIQAAMSDGVLTLSIPRNELTDKDIKRIDIAS